MIPGRSKSMADKVERVENLQFHGLMWHIERGLPSYPHSALEILRADVFLNAIKRAKEAIQKETLNGR